MAIDLNLISVVAFYSLVFLYFYIKRKNVTRQLGVIFLYKTQKFTGIMRAVANWNPKFWQWFGYASIPIGFTGMFVIFGYLIHALIKVLTTPGAQAGLSLAVPGVHIPGSIFIPFWYGIVALFTVIVVHEGMHGVVSEAWGIKLKSAGVGLAAILPLAFVEPPEDKLTKAKTGTQLGIFSAGVSANLISAICVFLLLNFAIAPAADGVLIKGIDVGTPAALAGMQTDEVITQASGASVKTVSDFSEIMKNVKPGEYVTIATNKNQYLVKTIENPDVKAKNRAYIGISFRQSFPWGLFHLSNLLYWMFVLNIGIGLVNLLPLGPIDGGRMLKIVLDRKMKNQQTAAKLFSAVTYLSLFLLLANIIVPYLVRAAAVL